jgi:hypothetical protein
MKCDRCGSAMIQEKFYGPQEHFLGWRCIFCGEIIDYLILENRRLASLMKKQGKKQINWTPDLFVH